MQGAIKQDVKPASGSGCPRWPCTATYAARADADLIRVAGAAMPDARRVRDAELSTTCGAGRGATRSAVLLGILRRVRASRAERSERADRADRAAGADYINGTWRRSGENLPGAGLHRGSAGAAHEPAVHGRGAGAPRPARRRGRASGSRSRSATRTCSARRQPHYLPDATLLVNVSNDARVRRLIAPHQHLQTARVRVAKVGRALLR